MAQTINTLSAGALTAANAATGDKIPVWDASAAATKWMTVDELQALMLLDVDGPWVSVKAYGALGDGSTDDTTEIAAAVTAAGVSGVVYFPDPASIYLISDTLQPLDNQVWLFDRGAYLKFASGTSGKTGIAITAGVDDVTLIDAYVDGNAANTTNCGGITVYGDRATLIRPKIKDVDSYPIYSLDATLLVIDEPDITGTVGNIGIFADHSAATASLTGPTIRGGRVDRSAMPVSLTGGGIQIRGSASYDRIVVQVIGVEIKMPSQPDASSNLCIEARYCEGALIHGNTLIGGSMGASLDTAPNSMVTDNVIRGFDVNGVEVGNSSDKSSVTGNTINGADLGATGVALQGATGTNDDVLVSGNTIERCDTRGVYLFTAKRAVIAGNSISMPDGDAIYVQEQEGWTISGNQLYGGDTPAGLHGVVITGSLGNGVIAANRIENFATAAITLAGTTAITIDDIAIVGNEFENNTAIITQSLSGGAALGTNIRVQANLGLVKDYLDLKNDVVVAWGAGSPESTLAAGVGSLYHRRDGGSGTAVYVKASGAGNTGWEALQPLDAGLTWLDGLNFTNEATFKAAVNLEANTDFYAPGGTDVPVTDGGTGASTAAGARSNLVAAASGANTDITSLAGTTSDDNAAAGKIGEYQESEVLSGSAVSLTTGVAANVTSLSLTAGDWDVSGAIGFLVAAGTLPTSLRAALNTTSATLPTNPAKGAAMVLSFAYPASTNQFLPAGSGRRLSLAGTTTVYLIAYADFTVSTLTAYGLLKARRAR